MIIWGIWYAYTSPSSFSILEQNWPISLTMIFGSFIAGATSEGGGAIAFPVFTKILHIPPFDAKVFSLAIQSIGMMAASLTIIVMRVPVEWRVIIWASLGGTLGVIVGSILLTPLLPAALIKMLFTAMVVSFAVTLILLNWKSRTYNQCLPIFYNREKWVVLITGFFGGIMTGLVGTGIDIVCFSVMVLLFRLPEKVSTPTSVILMAINSWIGFALHVLVVGGFSNKVESYWLAAIPVVVIGAPLGAYFCTRLNNQTIAKIVIGLILMELISSIFLIPLTGQIISISLLVFFVFLSVYYRLSISERYTFDLQKDKLKSC